MKPVYSIFVWTMAALLFAMLFCCSLTTATVPPNEEYETDTTFEAWEEWKSQYGRQFRTRSEHDTRFSTFARNLAAINEWNRRIRESAELTGDEDEVVLAMNRFGDLNEDEFRSRLGLNITVIGDINEVDVNSLPQALETGATVDFRTRGAVAPVLNQGSCGGCWAYAVTGMCEGARAVSGRGLTQLSPQQLIDCNRESPNNGCYGGDTGTAMRYVINNGLERLSDYPITGWSGTCKYSPSRVTARFSDLARVPYGDEGALARTLVSYGPLAIAMDASTFAFQFYHSGILRDSSCNPNRLNHGLVLVGFTPYSWIIKNSWGDEWGQQGFIQVARNRNNMCGVATYAMGAVSA